MAPDQNIIYIKNKDIDKTKWDRCILSSTNSLIYARSFWLDEICKWDALVLNNYEAVMPLTYNKKWGLYYLYQPYFTKQLGVFGKNITTDLIRYFLKTIPAKFKLWDIDLLENSIDHSLQNDFPNIILKERKNFLLPLNKNYNELKQDYKRLAKRMINQCAENNITIEKNVAPSEIINFFKSNYTYDRKISDKIYARLTNASNAGFKNQLAFTYVAKASTGETVGAYLILKDDRFIYSLLGGSNEMGKTTGAFYLLTDAAIRDNADSDRIFRFEGSDKKGIAFFNSQFNAQPVEYFHLYLNELPFPLNFFK